MKKYLLSFVSLFLVTLFAAAQESEPVEKLFADGKYYLQNVESGLYWGAGNAWGTQASLVNEYQYVTLTSKEDGTYTMESMVSNGGTNYYFGGDFMDGPAANLTFAKSGDYYTIAIGENYFGYDGSSTVLGKNLAADSPNALWNLRTEEDIQAEIATRIAGLGTATQDNPADATFLIKDANFGRNRRDAAEVWTIEAANKNLAGGGDNGNGCAESYHSEFTLSQIIANAPKGVYRLTTQGFYRQDGSDTENLPVFYINNGTAEATATFPLRTGTENSMNEAGAAFASGKYTAGPMFIELSDGGTLTVGAKLTVNTNLWCIWDNFQLTYYGPDADIAALSFGDLVEQLSTLRQTAETLESNENILAATKQALQTALQGAAAVEQTEEAYNAAIAALDAAIKQANAEISAKTAINGMYAELDATNVYTAEAYETYKGLADGYLAALEEGTLTETVVNPQALAGWHSANAIDDLLLSAWTIGGEQAKDYDKGLYINTWSVEGDTDGTDFRVPFFEYWTGDDQSLGKNTLTATVEGVEPGQYDVTAWIRVRAKNGYTAPAYGISLDINGGESVDVAAGEQVGTSQFYLAEYTAEGTVAEDGILKINFNIAEDNNISWLSFKNVKYAVSPATELTNADFSASTPTAVSVHTYAKDIVESNVAQAQEVEGWTIAENGDARAAAVYAYGSEQFLGGAGFVAPATNPEGEATGNALGLVGVWTGKIQYTQTIKLDAGEYLLQVPVYNAGGTTAFTANLIGVNDTYATATTYPVGKWTTEQVKFTVEKRGPVTISLGYTAANAGSAAMPHLFIDQVKILDEADIAAALLAAAKTNALNEIEALPKGNGLFCYGWDADMGYAAHYDEATYAIETATDVESVEAAVALYKLTIALPDPETEYMLQSKQNDLYLNLTAEGISIAEKPIAVTFEQAEEDGKYYIKSGEFYVGLVGTDNWSMTSAADKKAALAITLTDGYYTLAEEKGFVGVDYPKKDNKGCWANKGTADGDAILWTISEYGFIDIDLASMKVEVGNTPDEDGMLDVNITYTVNEVLGAFEGASPDFIGVLYKGEEAVKEFNFGTYLDPIEGTIAGGGIKGGISGLEYDTDYTLVITKAQFWNGFTADWTYNYVYSKDIEVKSATINIPTPAVVLNAPTFNYEEGTQAEPNIQPKDNPLKITFTADNLEANGINAEDVKVKVTVLVTGDLPEATMGMGSETAHSVRGESFYIPLGETDFPVALKEGYVYQNVAVLAAQLVKPATEEEGSQEEVIATYAGAPIQLHWVGVEAPAPEITYVYTDLTDDMFHNWSTTDATAEITASVPDVANFENNIGKEVSAGGVVYGTGTVYYQSYAQLADYDVMKIERASAEGGTPRLLFGRLTDNGGEYIEISSAESEYVTASEDGLTWIIDLNKIEENKEGLANLNVIKSSWGGPVTITSVQLGKVAGEEPAETTIDIAFERIENQGYTAEEVEYDEAAILEALGLEEWNGIEMYPVVMTTGEAGKDNDGWRDINGDPAGWSGEGTNLGLCLKYPHDGSMTLCTHPGNDPAAGSELSAAWVLSANGKSVTLNVTVTFVEAPSAEITLSDKIVKASVDYVTDEASYTFKKVDLNDEDVATILAETGLTDIAKATPLGYNPSTGELLTMFDGYDGWRDAKGDFHNWTGNSTAPACVKVYETGNEFTGRNFYCYNIAGCEPQTVKTYWALAGETKAVLVEISFTYTPATAITSLQSAEGDIEAVYTIGGAQLQGLQKGMNIVKYANGTIKKVFVK